MSKTDAPLKAVLQSAVCPDEIQKQRFLAFLEKKYRTKVELIWEKVETGDNGFCLRVGAEVYDWSVKGRFEQFRTELQKLSETSAPVILRNIPMARMSPWIACSPRRRGAGLTMLFCGFLRRTRSPWIRKI